MTQLGEHTRTEISTQPEDWKRAIHESVRAAPSLPQPGERVLMLGCGTSHYIGSAYGQLREEAGGGLTDALVASELPAARRQYDRVVAISRSGTSIELIDAALAFAGHVPVTALLGDTDTPLARTQGIEVVDLSWADERSVVQTRFATSALMLMRANLGADLDMEVEDARLALDALPPPLPTTQLIVLAHGWPAALAAEGALKVREAAAAWVEAYPTGEYRHGPIATAGDGSLVWGLTTLPPTLVEEVEAAGARVEQPTLSPMAELIRVQRFALQWATAKGRDADSPALLGRSVTAV